MNGHIRRFIPVILIALICTFLLTFFSYYAYGVIEKSNVAKELENYADIIYEYSESDYHFDDSDIMHEIKSEFNSKTRTVSIVLKNYSDLSSESLLEEMRVAVGAEEISICDENGNITNSTNMYSEGEKIKDSFISHIDDTVYTDSILTETDSGYEIISATKKSGSDGMIQITYSADGIVDKIGLSQIYDCISNISAVTDTSFGIIDKSTEKYLISSDDSEVNQVSEISYDKFEKDSGKFTTKLDGSKVFLFYKKIDIFDNSEYTIIAYLPYSATKKISSVIAKWVFAICCIISTILILSFRNNVLRLEKEVIKDEG